jgi:16S rRNA (guanine(527)-N(7))-methyltransferase RsmG
MAGFRDRLRAELGSDWAIPGDQLVLLAAHYERLRGWSRRVNLTGVGREDEICRRLYCESVALAVSLPGGGLRVLDLGSGAGFPGFVIAVCRPECAVTLVEADLKKAVFLTECAAELVNCEVVRDRVERVEGRWDWVVARAVAWSEVEVAARRLAGKVGLLVSERQVRELRREEGWDWEAAKALPWVEGHSLLLGSVRSRESEMTMVHG